MKIFFNNMVVHPGIYQHKSGTYEIYAWQVVCQVEGLEILKFAAYRKTLVIFRLMQYVIVKCLLNAILVL